MLLVQACANELAPTGGPKDMEAPKLQSKTMQDSSVLFKGGKIEFEFDEKLSSKDITIQTFPLMKTTPKVEVKGKKVIVNLPDTLLEANTTYKLDLGSSIKDNNEGNAYTKLAFTFSTGAVLDTLNLVGNVYKSATGAADTSAWVFLYPAMQSDSELLSKKPLYATKADGRGIFNISNLPNKEFYMYAVADANYNLKLDYPMEAVAYLPTTVLPYTDKSARIILRTFVEQADTNRKKITSRGGSIPITNVTVNVDTTDSTKRSFDITKPIVINFPKKITNWNKGKVRLFVDKEIDETGITLWDTVKNTIVLNAALEYDKVYTLTLLDSFANAGTTYFKGNSYTFRTKKDADYGSLKIILPTKENTYNKYIQLYQAEQLIISRLVKDSVTTITSLMPGTYTVRILHDQNDNKQWDNGSLFINKKQPELIEQISADVLIKANWENKLEVK
jgi:hypothetical protein